MNGTNCVNKNREMDKFRIFVLKQLKLYPAMVESITHMAVVHTATKTELPMYLTKGRVVHTFK